AVLRSSRKSDDPLGGESLLGRPFLPKVGSRFLRVGELRIVAHKLQPVRLEGPPQLADPGSGEAIGVADVQGAVASHGVVEQTPVALGTRSPPDGEVKADGNLSLE